MAGSGQMTFPSPPKQHILVIDDEPFVCEAVRLMLDTDGHTVQTATSGRDALALLDREHFDLVLTDFNMPEMKGDELAVIIKNRDPNQAVVMITAYPEVMPEAKVDGVIPKPFRLEDLRKVVAKFAKRA